MLEVLFAMDKFDVFNISAIPLFGSSFSELNDSRSGKAIKSVPDS